LVHPDAPPLAIELQVKAHLAQRFYIMAYTGFHDTIIVCVKAYFLSRVTIDDVKQLSLEDDDLYPSTPLG
jgi:hypothetical protein